MEKIKDYKNNIMENKKIIFNKNIQEIKLYLIFYN